MISQVTKGLEIIDLYLNSASRLFLTGSGPGTLVKFSVTINVVEFIFYNNWSPEGIGVLWSPPTGLGYLGGLD